MNRESFGTGIIYHVFNRGSDKRNVFLDIADHQRFTNGLLEYNDANPARDPRNRAIMPRVKLVEILCYCLMPNHFHLMLRQVREDGITQFMRKLGTGYTMYFNKKYDRNGVLFQGIFKSVPVEKDTYLRYLPHYIHLNPLELSTIVRDARGIGADATARHLRGYRWSSYPEYVGMVGRSIADTEYLNALYAPGGYDAALADWIQEYDARSLAPLILD